MERDIIEIDEERCVGCGACVPNCHQGALQIIDGKARLLSDLFCEGLGACVGTCPTGAMTIARRPAEPYDEAKVMEKIASGGPNVIRAHLEHLAQHGQSEYLAQAHAYLNKHKITVPAPTPRQDKHQSTPATAAAHETVHAHHGGGCPGSRAMALRGSEPATDPHAPPAAVPSRLRQWPVQLQLLNPAAPYLRGADLLLAADCTAYAAGSFHETFLKDKILAIACPKLDHNLQAYVEKLAAMIDQSGINTLSVLIMEVPCCAGLVQIAAAAVRAAQRAIPIKRMVLSLEGSVIAEDWILDATDAE